MLNFALGVLFGVVLATGVHEVRSTPKVPMCTVESGDSFWTRKKSEVPCPPGVK